MWEEDARYRKKIIYRDNNHPYAKYLHLTNDTGVRVRSVD